MSRLVGIVPARGHSEGIPGKHLKKLGDWPLLFWTLVPAVRACDLVILTSDDPAILDEAKIYVGTNLFLLSRPAILATARTPDYPVMRHAYDSLAEKEPDDVIVLLRPTAPFRRAEEIRHVAEILQHHRGFDSVRSVLPAHEHPAKMYLEAGFARGRDDIARHPLLVPALGPGHRANHPRQWLALAWRACGFIDCVRADVLVGLDTLEGDLIVGWPAPPDRALDLDTPEDWEHAEHLVLERSWRPGEIA